MPDRKKLEQMTLGQLVTLVADDSSPDNVHALFHALLVSKVGARVPNPGGAIKSGPHRTTANDHVKLPSTQAPDGSLMILVYCDIPAMFAAYPKDAFVELDSRTVLEMAKQAGMGVIVQNMLDGKESWVGVSKEQVIDILDNRSGH